jgi:CrcB protein
MKHLLFVALGGAAGCVTRYWLSDVLQRLTQWPSLVGIAVINITGSFLIGMLFVLITEKLYWHPDWRSVLIVGFLGGYTTFSSFSLDTIAAIESGRWAVASIYVLASVLLSLLACAGGLALARHWLQ